MPLYLVRWPGLEASIVRADDVEHLTDILDEVNSPTEAWWTEYEGPLWVDVGLGMSAEREGEGWRLGGVESAATEPHLGATIRDGDCETGSEMFTAILVEAFPNLAQVCLTSEGEELSATKVRDAALLDLAGHRGSGKLPASLREVLRKRHHDADDDET